MAKLVRFTIDKRECMAEEGSFIVDAARENHIYIPTLCNVEGVKPRGACRICTIKVNGRLMTACTTPVSDGMEIENVSDEINNLRVAILELLFIEGNHFCPACEKSGRCELQALGYRYKMMAPRYPYQFPLRGIEASNPKLIKDHNRCILCKRCIRIVKDEEGRSIFAFKKRGHQVEINIDTELARNMSDEMAEKAMKACPVGALLLKEKGWDEPYGTRIYDKVPIGSDIEINKISK